MFGKAGGRGTAGKWYCRSAGGGGRHSWGTLEQGAQAQGGHSGVTVVQEARVHITGYGEWAHRTAHALSTATPPDP